jgi:thymidylate synthase
MEQYYQLVSDILNTGNKRENRTGVSSFSLFGRQIRFSLGEKFPFIPIRACSKRR